MIRFRLVAAAALLAAVANAQTRTITTVQHLSFDRPEAWALKYFTAVTFLSGLQPPALPVEGRRVGSLTVGLETGWLPALTPEQARVGFTGSKQEDLNKAPIFVRPSLRVGLPWRLDVVAAGPAPLEVFGVTPRLFALGVERPILERDQWRLGWRAYGQLGSVEGAFTCPSRVLAFPPGSDNNPTGCVGKSRDEVFLRYGGTELQFSRQMPKIPKLTPHLALGVNWIHSTFQVKAPLENAFDRTRLWTAGKVWSGTGGVSYLLTQRMSLTVDAFYSPLSVRRVATGPRTNDGLFNVRALLSYTLR